MKAKTPTIDLVSEWIKEFTRTTGKQVDVVKVSPVSYVPLYDDLVHSPLKRSDFLNAIPVLKSRPTFANKQLPTD